MMREDLKGSMIDTVGLTKFFGNRAAVDGVSLSVQSGAIFGLIGPNGAGKSTLIKMLTTLLPPTHGTARVAGYDVQAAPRGVRQRIGYVPQLVSADGALTGRENLLLSARLYLIPRAERDGRIQDALELIGLVEAADRLAQTYSGWMLRRLEIAQSMLHRPNVLIMDEPTVGLDPVARHAIQTHIRGLRDRLGATIFLTTHAMEEAEALCDRIGVLHQGKLERQLTPADLKATVGPAATLWLVLFGEVMAQVRGITSGGGSYIDFLAPGILAQSVLFAAIFFGIAAIWERDLGVLHRYMVSPAPRSALVLGKGVSSAVRGLTQALMVNLLALNLDLSPLNLLGVVFFIALGSALFSTFSLIIACLVRTRQRFMGIGQVLTILIFFASNAIYPVSLMPPWLQRISHGNPLTYEVDGLRALMLVSQASVYGIGFDSAVLVALFAVHVGIATRLYPRMTR